MREIPAAIRALQAENEGPRARVGVTLSAAALHEVLDYINPDGRADSDQLEAEAHIMWREKFDSIDGDPMPAGLYAYDTAYPEEGLVGPLGETLPATPPQAPAAQLPALSDKVLELAYPKLKQAMLYGPAYGGYYRLIREGLHAAAPAAPQQGEASTSQCPYCERMVADPCGTPLQECKQVAVPTDDESRAAFERWWTEEGSAPHFAERDQRGDYISLAARSAWRVWQACARTLATQEQPK